MLESHEKKIRSSKCPYCLGNHRFLTSFWVLFRKILLVGDAQSSTQCRNPRRYLKLLYRSLARALQALLIRSPFSVTAIKIKT